MRVVIAIVVAMSWVGVSPWQAPSSGIELVVKVEARRLAGQDVPEQIARIIETQMPDGSAEVQYITDGKGVRSTLSGRMFGLGNGTIRLVAPGSSDMYVLNPTDRTYSLTRETWGSLAGKKPEFHFQLTNTFRTILGYKAQRVLGSYRQMVELPAAEGSDAKVVREVRAEIENWCTSELKIPVLMGRMMDTTQRLVGRSDFQYSDKCPLPLESAVKTSVLPGFEIVSTTTSIRRLSKLPPRAFQLPDGYRKAGEGATAK